MRLGVEQLADSLRIAPIKLLPEPSYCLSYDGLQTVACYESRLLMIAFKDSSA